MSAGCGQVPGAVPCLREEEARLWLPAGEPLSGQLTAAVLTGIAAPALPVPGAQLPGWMGHL